MNEQNNNIAPIPTQSDVPVQNVPPVEQAQVVQEVPVENVAGESATQQQVVTPQVETVVQPAPTASTVEQQPVQGVAQPTIQPQAVQNAQVQQPQTTNQVAVDEFGNPTSLPLTPNAAINSSSINTTGYNGMLDATSVGFVASDSSLPKKKNKGLIIGIILAVLLALGLLGYFVILPFVVKTYFSNPKNVYEGTIRTVLKNVSNTASDVVKSKAIYDVQLSLDTNVETLKLFSGYTYSANLGIDPENKALQYGYLIKDEATVGHSYYNYFKNGNNYIRYSTYRDLIYTGAVGLDQPALLSLTYQDIFDAASNAKAEDVEYLINKITDLVVNGIDENKLIKEDASITVDGEVLKVINNKYEFNKETVKYMQDSIINGLANDDKALEILAKINKTNKDEIKKSLTEETKSEDDEDTIDLDTDTENDDYAFYTNIYTYGFKNEIVGISINNNEDKDEVTYYNLKDYFELNYVYEETDIVTEKETIQTIKAVGRTQTGRTNVVITKNNTETNEEEEIAKLNVKKWETDQYEFDYETTLNKSTVKGTVRLAKESTDEKLNNA